MLCSPLTEGKSRGSCHGRKAMPRDHRQGGGRDRLGQHAGQGDGGTRGKGHRIPGRHRSGIDHHGDAHQGLVDEHLTQGQGCCDDQRSAATSHQEKGCAENQRCEGDDDKQGRWLPAAEQVRHRRQGQNGEREGAGSYEAPTADPPPMHVREFTVRLEARNSQSRPAQVPVQVSAEPN